jgi:ribosomal protein S21
MSVNAEVFVRGGDVDKALRRLRKACELEHVIADMRRGEFYTKPSQAKRIRRLRALNRERKMKALFG